MRALLLGIFPLFLAATLGAQNLVPNGDFEAGATGWTRTSFNDPLGSTGFAVAPVILGNPTMAVFADFQTLTPVMSATFESLPFAMSAGSIDVSFDVMWEKPTTPPIPYPSVNRVELRLVDSVTRTNVQTFTLQVPTQTGLEERRSFSQSYTVANTGTYYVEVFMRHSNLAAMPFTTWVDNVVVGDPNIFLFGSGCAGTNGFTPSIRSVNAPAINTTNFAVELADAFAPSAAILALDNNNVSWAGLPLPLPLGSGGCEMLVGPLISFTQPVTGPGPGGGMASQVLPIPNMPMLQGIAFYTQWYVVDPAAANPFGFAMTAGLGFFIR